MDAAASGRRTYKGGRRLVLILVAFSVGCVLESDTFPFASSDEPSNFPSLATALNYVLFSVSNPSRCFFLVPSDPLVMRVKIIFENYFQSL